MRHFIKHYLLICIGLLSTTGFAESTPVRTMTWKNSLPTGTDIVEARFLRGALDIGGDDCDTFFQVLGQSVFSEIAGLGLYFDGTAACGRNTPDYDIFVYVIQDADRPLLDQLEKLLASVSLWGHVPVLRRIDRVVFDVTVRGVYFDGNSSTSDGYAWFVRRHSSYPEFVTWLEDVLVPKVRDVGVPEFLQWLADEAGVDQASAFKESLPRINLIGAFGVLSLVTPDNNVFQMSGMRGMTRDCTLYPGGRCHH